jgi:SAM-dependent methyltransferase
MTDARNIEYKSAEIADFYRAHRVRWEQFYESERVIFGGLGLGAASSVLDLGCGCGGLGLALRDKFGVTNYTGVEINRQAAESARLLYPGGRFLAADILAPPEGALPPASFDVVVSLSCIDWNVEFSAMLEAAWRYVRPGGCFVSSFRLTAGETLNDIRRSCQHINFDGRKEGEVAPYVVLNAAELLADLRALQPRCIRAFGYWGAPSASAVTPLERIAFAVFAIAKPAGAAGAIDQALDLPPEILAVMPR